MNVAHLLSHVLDDYHLAFIKEGNFFSSGARDGGSWLLGHAPEPAHLDARTAWQSDIRDGGRSLSDLRPDGPDQCSTLAGEL